MHKNSKISQNVQGLINYSNWNNDENIFKLKIRTF